MDRPHLDVPSDTPPILGSWRRWYVIVLIELAVIIVLSYVVTEVFR